MPGPVPRALVKDVRLISLLMKTQKVFPDLKRLSIYSKFNFFLIFCGILFRGIHYFQKTSFWLDEVNIVLPTQFVPFRNFLSGGFSHPSVPIKPLIFNLFLKSLGSLFGFYEWIMRVLPLTASVLALFLFYYVAKQYLSEKKVPLALGLFAFSPALIDYAAEVNTYASDVLVAVAVLALFLYVQTRGLLKEHIYFMGWVAMITPWLSYSAPFISIPAAVLIFARLYQEKDRERLFAFFSMCVFGMVSLLRLYQYYALPTLHSEEFIVDRMVYFPKVAGLPGVFPLLFNLVRTFTYESLGMRYPLLIGLLVLWGTIACLRRKTHRHVLLLMPFLCVAAAIMLRIYPSYARSLLFLSPLMYLILSEGVDFMARGIRRGKLIIISCVVTMLFCPPFIQSLDDLKSVQNREDNRQSMEFFMARYVPGDGIVLSEFGLQIFVYYLNNFRSRKPGLADPVSRNARQLNELAVWRLAQNLHSQDQPPSLDIFEYKTTDRLLFDHKDRDMTITASSPLFLEHSKRVWLILLHYHHDVKNFMDKYFASHGQMVDKYEGRGAAVYLYELEARTE